MLNTIASAYIKSGRLCIMGLHDCDLGTIPFAYSMEISKELKDGKVEVGAENLAPEIQQAIKESRMPIMRTIEAEKMRVASGSLVERARAGDQNAMAMLGGIRKSAESGDKRARRAVKLVLTYINNHPPGGSVHHYPAIKQLRANVGDDSAISAWTPGVPDLYVAALVLANGPLLVRERVNAIGSNFGDDVRAFGRGLNNWKKPLPKNCEPAIKRIIFTGRAVGLARVIQGVRIGKMPVSKLCPIAGWELGE